MKNLFIASVLAVSVVLPSLAIAADWYRLDDPGSHVDMYSKPGHRAGKLLCRPAHGEYFINRTDSEYVGTPNRYFRVYWMKRLGTMEWHWKDRFGKWCPLWDRTGFVDRQRLKKVDKPRGLWIN